MAINPETQYPGKIAPSSAAYPYGQARNITVPGDGTGTPWEAAIVNDLLGWQQALLSAAGIVPSGSPDEVGASEYLAAMFATAGRKVVSTTAALALNLAETRAVESLGYAAQNDGGEGALWVATGATVGGSAGTIDRTTGRFYDVNGLEFQYIFSRVNVLHFGEFGGGINDVKTAAEELSTFSISLYFPSTRGETYLFSSAPTLASGTTCIFDKEGVVTGATADEINAQITENGVVHGAAFSPEVRDKRVEIVSGTIRQQQPSAVAGITRSGTSGIVNKVAHGRVVGDWVVILGANETGYNGTHEVAQVDDVDTYRVVVDSGLATPATGTITEFGADVWEWIKDSGHEPLGVDDSTPVRADGSGYGLLVPFLKTYSKVLTVLFGPDETIAGAQSMVVGASVSTSAIAFRASLNKTVAGRVYYDGADWQVSMGTDQGTVYTDNAPNPATDIVYSAGNLTLSHSFCLGSDVQLTPHSGNGAVTPYIPTIKSLTDNGAVINFNYVNAGALATYTGAAVTNLSFQFTKNSNRLIKFDGSDRSSETSMYFGNIWFFGIMEL